MNGISAAVSGIHAGLHRQGNVAHNIANLNTEGARRLRTEQFDVSTGGTAVSTTVTSEPIDLPTELIEQRLAARQAQVAGLAFQTLDKMDETLLDILVE